MPERRGRFARLDGATGFVLTERDRAMVLACWEHRWLTRPQLQQIIGMSCVTRVNLRLRHLFDHGYLDRTQAATVGGGLCPVHRVGTTAIPLIQEHSDLSISTIRTRLRQDAEASALLLPQNLAVNDVRIALTQGINQRADLELGSWLTAVEACDAYQVGCVHRPDGFFTVRQGGVLHAFFVEVDRGSVSLPRWSAKVERYLEYRDTGAYRTRHGLTRFRVLVTAESPARMRNLRSATREVTDRSFWFAETARVIDDGDPGHPHWWGLQQDEPQPLIPG